MRTDSMKSEESIQFNNGLLRNSSFLKATRFGNLIKFHDVNNDQIMYNSA